MGVNMFDDVVDWYKDFAECKAGVPSRYVRKTLADFNDDNGRIIPAVKKWIDDFGNKSGEGIFMHGPYGNGKTLLSSILLQDVIKTYKIKGEFCSVPYLMSEIKALFGSDNNHEDRIEMFRKLSYTSILVFDDCDKINPTEFSGEFLFSLIDYRYANLLPTIYTTNASEKELMAKLGPAIMDRIQGNSISILFEGKSKRK